MLKVILNKNEEENILNGYPWVFNNEIINFECPIENGKVCSVYTYDHQFVAYGFLNTNSKIMVRILSLDENEIINKDFFEKRISYALEHRKTLGWDATRLIFSEADFLPGLIVDKYGDYLSVQFMSLGMDMIKQDIVDILVKLTGCKGIYERSDMPVREKEGLLQVKGFLYGKFDPRVEIIEDDIHMIVDMENGQKTGYFLDQKLNRDILRLYTKNRNVLDAFSNGEVNKSVISQGPSLVLFDSGDEEVNEMTWLFVKSILEPEFQSTFSQTSGYNPVRNSTFDIADYKAFLAKDTIVAQAAKTASGLTDWFYTSPAFKGSADARQYIGSALVSAIKGEATGVDALATAYKNCGGR